MRISIVTILFLTAHLASSTPLPKKEADFIRKHSAHLKGGGPGTKESSTIREFARIAAEFENYEAIAALFKLTNAGHLDASATTEFEIHIYSIFRKAPLFFISSADRYFSHKFDRIMFYLISEGSNSDYSDIDKILKTVEKTRPKDPRVIKFRERAEYNNKNLGQVDLSPK